jgi:hypothetical protein
LYRYAEGPIFGADALKIPLGRAQSMVGRRRLNQVDP